MSESEKPEKTAVPVQVFQALERRDEDQILAEMRGEIIEDLVYDITIQGKRITNLSYAGVKEAIRRRGNMEILDVHTEETEAEIRALVHVRDLENRIDVLGASSSEKEKPFAYTLAVNKAERNAFAKLIPAKWFALLIDEYLVRKIKTAEPKAPEEIPAFDPKELMEHDWKGKKKAEGEGYEKGTLNWGWDFANKFSEAVLKVLEKGPLPIDVYKFGYDKERGLVHVRKVNEKADK